MSLFASRLKELRTHAKLRAEDLSELGISRRMVFMYEKDESSPTLEKVIALADFFGVSLDYLAGRLDDPQREKFVPGMAKIKNDQE
ncbi:helix-turn-helix domain-containing protein [Anaerosinus sp.]|uniref:helix-turn-helix domain-containing protein n=1 Tax=Selenobaculum sp. TaxID=3074374 RepID=UPI003AB17F03